LPEAIRWLKPRPSSTPRDDTQVLTLPLCATRAMLPRRAGSSKLGENPSAARFTTLNTPLQLGPQMRRPCVA
jgi:hypothetical protein